MIIYNYYLSISAVSIAYAACLLGCSEDFAAYSRLDRLRVMAIQADPAIPLAGAPTQLSPLVYTPAGESASYSWSWCPLPSQPDDGYRCPMGEKGLGQLLEKLGLDPHVSFDLGKEQTARFVNPFEPASLAGLCDQGINAGKTMFDIWCKNDFPVLVMLKVATDSDSLVSVVTLNLPIQDDASRNQNPTIEGIRVITPTPARQLDELGTVRMARDEEVTLEATIPQEAAESFVDKNEDGKAVDRREILNITWFAEAGDWVADRTTYIEDELGFRSAIRNKWTSPKTEDYKKNRVSIFVVVRDDRGGVNWAQAVVALENAR